MVEWPWYNKYTLSNEIILQATKRWAISCERRRSLTVSNNLLDDWEDLHENKARILYTLEKAKALKKHTLYNKFPAALRTAQHGLHTLNLLPMRNAQAAPPYGTHTRAEVYFDGE